MIGKLLKKGAFSQYRKYLFNTKTGRMEQHKPWSRDGKKKHLIYICWSASPLYYRKGFGLFKLHIGEDKLLLSDYQFGFVLRHESMRNKLLRKGYAVPISELVKIYTSIKPDEINNSDLLLNDEAKEILNGEDEVHWSVQRANLSSV